VETGATCRDRFTDVAPRCDSLAQLCPSIISRESKPFEGRKWNGHPRGRKRGASEGREEKKRRRKRKEKKKKGQEEKSPRGVRVPLLNYGFVVCVAASIHGDFLVARSRCPVSMPRAIRCNLNSRDKLTVPGARIPETRYDCLVMHDNE